MSSKVNEKYLNQFFNPGLHPNLNDKAQINLNSSNFSRLAIGSQNNQKEQKQDNGPDFYDLKSQFSQKKLIKSSSAFLSQTKRPTELKQVYKGPGPSFYKVAGDQRKEFNQNPGRVWM